MRGAPGGARDELFMANGRVRFRPHEGSRGC